MARLNPGSKGKTWLTAKQLQDLQEQLVRGMLNMGNLLQIMRTCSVFMDTEDGPRIKVVCRYQ